MRVQLKAVSTFMLFIITMISVCVDRKAPAYILIGMSVCGWIMCMFYALHQYAIVPLHDDVDKEDV